MRTILVTAVMLAAAVLYTVRLNGVPPSLSTDETAFALQAHAIATTAHDTNGRLLPLYFQMVENVWFHPALVYAMAPVLGVLRPLPWVVRLPTVFVALCNILLVYAVAHRLGVSLAAAVKIDVACTPQSARDVCANIATTTSCPSTDTITVANNLALDRCGYLDQAAVTEHGLYSGVSMSYGIPIAGTFATTGMFRLSGSGVFQGSRYELTFSLTKRN